MKPQNAISRLTVPNRRDGSDTLESATIGGRKLKGLELEENRMSRCSESQLPQ